MAKQFMIKASDPGDKKPAGPPPQNPPPRPENPPITKEQPEKGGKPVRPKNFRATEAIDTEEQD